MNGNRTEILLHKMYVACIVAVLKVLYNEFSGIEMSIALFSNLYTTCTHPKYQLSMM